MVRRLRAGATLQAIHFRTFVLRPPVLGHFYSPATVKAHERLRSEVAQFINEEINKGGLVSISENGLGETGLTITVWYKGGAAAA